MGKGKPKGAQVAVCNAVQIFSDVDVGVLASTPNMIGNIVNKLKEREGGAGATKVASILRTTPPRRASGVQGEQDAKWTGRTGEP